jgi:hypothetical protein
MVFMGFVKLPMTLLILGLRKGGSPVLVTKHKGKLTSKADKRPTLTSITEMNGVVPVASQPMLRLFSRSNVLLGNTSLEALPLEAQGRASQQGWVSACR